MALEVHNPRSMKINLACASPEKELRAAESQQHLSDCSSVFFHATCGFASAAEKELTFKTDCAKMSSRFNWAQVESDGATFISPPPRARPLPGKTKRLRQSIGRVKAPNRTCSLTNSSQISSARSNYAETPHRQHSVFVFPQTRRSFLSKKQSHTCISIYTRDSSHKHWSENKEGILLALSLARGAFVVCVNSRAKHSGCRFYDVRLILLMKLASGARIKKR